MLILAHLSSTSGVAANSKKFGILVFNLGMLEFKQNTEDKEKAEVHRRAALHWTGAAVDLFGDTNCTSLHAQALAVRFDSGGQKCLLGIVLVVRSD